MSLDQQEQGATGDALPRFIPLGESDGEGCVEHFLDNNVDSAERATVFLGSGDCGADRSTLPAGSSSSAKELNYMRCGYSQHCLRKLSSDDVESRLNVMEMEKEDRDLFVLGIMPSQHFDETFTTRGKKR